MEECRPTKTPADPGLVLTLEMCPNTSELQEEMKARPYKELVGSLFYAAACTRPDIAQAVGAVSRFMSNPGPTHWTAAKRILRYLRGTESKGIIFRKSQTSNEGLLGYVDADWGGDLDKRKSTTGYVFFYHGGPVSWMSKLQSTVATSSTHAEYIALFSAAQEAVYLIMRGLLRDCNIHLTAPTKILEGNQGAIALVHNPVHLHARSKHIAVKYHFTRECQEDGEIKVEYCPTEEMIADCLTKPLGTIKMERCRARLLGE